VTNTRNAVATHLPISAVERDTGLSKDVLRVWERRYGFPAPDRDAHGERAYPMAQVERLRTLKRLLDAGYRPGKLLLLDERGLTELNARHAGDAAGGVSAICAEVFDLLRRSDLISVKRLLARQMLKQGLRLFITDSVAQLNHAVAQAVVNNELSPFHQRAYTQSVETLLRNTIESALSDNTPPRVLLASISSEEDALSLLMTQAVLAPEDVACVSIGANVPVYEIVAAASAFNTDVVITSFTAAYSHKQAANALKTLRQLLAPEIALWVSGDSVRRLRFDADGVFIAPSLAEVLALARQWQAANS
jgi:MerR family transcriptional regulator, light-induced transcriptional regulator